MGLVDAPVNQSGIKPSSILGTVFVTTITYLILQSLRKRVTEPIEDEASISESPILQDGYANRAFKTSLATYPAIRTFYRPHKHREKLQTIAELPLLVFIHGLGGSLEQFAPLLGSLVNVGPCFGIELPGHGRSTFAPKVYAAYTVDASATLWRSAIAEACQEHGHTKVILVGHSMGCSISALIASEFNPKFDVIGMVGICPKASPPSEAQSSQFRRLLSLPNLILDTFRYFDKRGGVDSKSVKRFVGEGADLGLRRSQLQFNEQFKTPVWKRAAIGCLPTYDSKGEPRGGMPGKATWSRIEAPLLLIAGEADTVTKPQEVADVVSYLQHRKPPTEVNGSIEHNTASEAVPTAAEAADPPAKGPPPPEPTSSDKTFGTQPTLTEKKSHHSVIIKTAILPSPASHALLYDPANYRTVAGLIEDFLAEHVNSHLSLGWQLQSLTTTGKWDVKNLEKWQRTLPVSGPICTKPPTPGGLFRALKTLREQDDSHTPKKFLADWKDKIYAVIDISHDAPIYDTTVMDKGGIHYHKFPTVSKVPPTVTEVRDFIALIDRLRAEMESNGQAHKAIAVHCHYGYNRTGFFICCYLIERKKFLPGEAVEEFQRAKPPGIKHEHFVDTLYVRYCVGA